MDLSLIVMLYLMVVVAVALYSFDFHDDAAALTRGLLWPLLLLRAVVVESWKILNGR